jgi:hypothetical protein
MDDMNDFYKIDAFFKTLEEKTMANGNNNDITISDKHTSVMFFKAESDQLAIASRNRLKNKEEEKNPGNIACYIVSEEAEDVVKQRMMINNGEIYFLHNHEYFYIDNNIKRLNCLYTEEEIKLVSLIFIVKYTANAITDQNTNYSILRLGCDKIVDNTVIKPNVSFYYQNGTLSSRLNEDIKGYYGIRPQKSLSVELMKRNYNISHENYFNIITGRAEVNTENEKQKLMSKY